MRFIQQYAGVILILAVVAVLATMFYTTGLDNITLGCSALAVVIGILLMIFGGRTADKIGGGTKRVTK